MKKFILLLLIVGGFAITSAKAQTVSYTTVDSISGFNNQGTFCYWVTTDGYLHYELLTDNEGLDNYESYLYIAVGPSYYYNIMSNVVGVYQYGGGSITGSVYIGTTDADVSIQWGTGFITGPGSYGGVFYAQHIDFP